MKTTATSAVMTEDLCLTEMASSSDKHVPTNTWCCHCDDVKL